MKNFIYLFFITILILKIDLVSSQSHCIASWDAVNTSSTSFPLAGNIEAPIVSSTSMNQNGFTPIPNFMNHWSSTIDNPSKNPTTASYISYKLNLSGEEISFDRFVAHGFSINLSVKEAEVRWSVDNYATNLGKLTAEPGFRTTSVELPKTVLTGETDVEFRIYNHIASIDLLLAGWQTTIPSINTPARYSTVIGRSISIFAETKTRIVAQPEKLTNGSIGDLPVKLTTLAVGKGIMRYQWKKDGVDIIGATASTIDITTIALNSGTYTCLVGSDMGSDILSENSVVNINPQITTSKCLTTWKRVNTAVTGYPQSGALKHKKIVSASTHYSGFIPENDADNLWKCNVNNPSSDPNTSAYLSYKLNSGGNKVVFDRIVSYGFSISDEEIGATVRWSIDNFGSDLGQFREISNSTSISSVQLPRTVVNGGSEIEFRIYLNKSETKINLSAWSLVNSSDGTPSRYTPELGTSISIFGEVNTSIQLQPVGITNITIGDPSITLQTIGDGKGELKYQWKKDGVDISGENSSIITISSISVNTGTYTCLVSSDLGSDILSENAIVNINKPITTSKRIAYWDVVNTTVTAYPLAGTTETSVVTSATCSAIGFDGIDAPKTQWMSKRDGQLDDPTTAAYLSYKLSASGEFLSFDRITAHGFNINSLNKVAEVRWSIDNFASIIGEFTSPSTSYEATSVQLPRVTINTATEIEFRIYIYDKDTKISYIGSNKALIESKNYIVEYIWPSDKSIEIFGETATEITTQPMQLVNMAENESVVTLTTIGAGKGVTYQWKKDGLDLVGETSSNLNINSTLGNSGTYTCLVSSEMGADILSNDAVVNINSIQSTSRSLVSWDEVGLTSTVYPHAGDIKNSKITSATTNYSGFTAKSSPTNSWKCEIANPSKDPTTSSYLSYKIDLNGNHVKFDRIVAHGFDIFYYNHVQNNFWHIPKGDDSAELRWSVDNFATSLGKFNEIDNERTLSSVQLPPAVIMGALEIEFRIYHNNTEAYLGLNRWILASKTDGTPTRYNPQDATSISIFGNTSTEIITQPVTTTSNCEGDPATTLSTEGAGVGVVTYQWKKDGTDILGAISATLNINNNISDAGTYTCLVGSDLGPDVLSSGSTVIITPSTKITSQPAALTTVCEGAAAITLSTTGSGTGVIKYQWQKDAVDILGETSSIINITTTAENKGEYTCRIESDCIVKVTSQKAVVEITPMTKITTNPSATVTKSCVGAASINLSVIAEGTAPITFQWEKDGSPIVGKTLAAIEITTLGENSGLYACRVQSGCGVDLVSNKSTIDISNQTTTITVQPASTTVAGEGTPEITLICGATSSSPIVYQWNKDGVAIVNENSASISIETDPVNTGNYTCTARNECGAEATSAIASVTITPKTKIVTQPQFSTVGCKDGVDIVLKTEAIGSGTIKYQWYRDEVKLTTETSSEIRIIQNRSNSGIYYCKVSSDLGDDVKSSDAIVNIISNTIVTLNPESNITQCNGDSDITLSIEALGSGSLTFQWYKDNSSISGATSKNLTLEAIEINNGEYKCNVNSECGSDVYSTTSNILIGSTAPIEFTMLPDENITTGEGASISNLRVETTNGGKVTYQWFKNGSKLNRDTTKTLWISSTPENSGNYYCHAYSSCGGNAISRTSRIEITNKTKIITEPKFEISQCIGMKDIVLSLDAQGTGTVQYQWYKNRVKIDGEVANSLTLESRPSSTGSYSCLVKSDHGENIFSNVSEVKVHNNTSISQQPIARTVCQSEDSVKISVDLSEYNNNTYQWYKAGVALSKGQNRELTINSTIDNSGEYHCKVTGECGEAVTSNNTTVNITPKTVITQQPSLLIESHKRGSDILLTLSAQGTEPIGYQWYCGDIKLSNETYKRIDISKNHKMIKDYYCVVSSGCENTIRSEQLSTRIEIPITIVTKILDRIVQNEGDTTITLVADVLSGEKIMYKWYKNDLIIKNSTNSLITIESDPENSGEYRYEIINVNNKIVKGNSSEVVINPKTTITKHPEQSTTTNEGDSEITLVAEAEGTGTLKYQWYNSNGKITGETNSTITISTEAENNDSYYCVVSSDVGIDQKTNVAEIVINPLTRIVAQPLALTNGCIGAIIQPLQVEATGTAPLKFQWFNDGVKLKNDTLDNLNIGSESESNSIYNCEIKGNNGSVVKSIDAKVVISPNTEIIKHPTKQIIVSKNDPNIVLRTSARGRNLTYQWFMDDKAINNEVADSIIIETVETGSNKYHCIVKSLCSEDVTSKSSEVKIFNDGEDIKHILTDFETYPNPTEGKITIDLKQQCSKIDVKISNIVGMELYMKTYKNVDNIELLINGPKGVYFVEVVYERTKKVFKILKK